MSKSPILYRIDVVPLTPLYGGRRDPRFSYASTESVLPGSLVSISFGKRMLTGVTLDATKLTGPVPEWMKFIGPVLLPGFLTSSQIALAWNLSDRLYAPLGIVLKLFLPIQRKPRGNKDTLIEGSAPKVARRKKTTRQRYSDPIIEGLATDEALLDRLKELGQAAHTSKRPVCILVPEVLAAELYAEKLRLALPEARIACLSSRRTDKEVYTMFQAIKQETFDVILGTRQAVFAPFGTLSAIAIIDAEKQLSYSQWEMAPRYDAIEIAESLALERNIPCLKLSPAPGIEYFASDIALARAGTPFAFSSQCPLVPIDLRKSYKRSGTNAVLSPELITALRLAQTKGEAVLILVKQRGLSRFSLCAKCQTPQRCPTCATALSEMKDGRFRCLACGYRSALFPSCSECGHMYFKSFGAGTEAVRRALHRAGLGDNSTLIDRDAQNLKRDFQKLVSDLADPKPPLTLIATYEAAHSLPLPPLGVIGLIEPDQGLFYPDFRSEERLWRELRRFGAKLGARGKLYVQTFNPESAHWTNGATDDHTPTATKLLEERRALHYPPYYRLIRLDCYPRPGVTSLLVAEEAEAALQKLTLPRIEILPKYLPFNRKNRYHILIRYPRDIVLPKELHLCLAALDPSVHITHNPLSLHD